MGKVKGVLNHLTMVPFKDSRQPEAFPVWPNDSLLILSYIFSRILDNS